MLFLVLELGTGTRRTRKEAAVCTEVGGGWLGRELKSAGH